MSIQEHYVVSVCDEKNTCLNAEILAETLAEEKKTNEILTAIAESSINYVAATEGEEEA